MRKGPWWVVVVGVIIAVGLSCVSVRIGMQVDRPPQTPRAAQDSGWALYEEGRNRAAAAYYRRGARMADTARVRVGLLMQSATLYGYAGEYGKQYDALVQASQVARQAGLDSLGDVAARSLGNVAAYCARENVSCGGRSETGSGAPWGVLFIIVVVMLVVAAGPGGRRPRSPSR